MIPFRRCSKQNLSMVSELRVVFTLGVSSNLKGDMGGGELSAGYVGVFLYENSLSCTFRDLVLFYMCFILE